MAGGKTGVWVPLPLCLCLCSLEPDRRDLDLSRVYPLQKSRKIEPGISVRGLGYVSYGVWNQCQGVPTITNQ